MRWEPVFTISNQFDIPRQGVANFLGKPCAFQSKFCDAKDDYTDRFLLMEIAPDLFRLVLENHKIFLRWRDAYRRGIVSLDSHLALTDDRTRHIEIKQLIGHRLHIEPAKSVIRSARFRRVADGGEVQWYDVGMLETNSSF
ncbi:MAG TPA: hypothetical protein VGJ20_44080 [Xanthobacteraceae bacterium]